MAHSPLLDRLQTEGHLTEDQCLNVMAEASRRGESVESVIVGDSLLEEESVAKVLADLSGYRFVQLEELTVDRELLQKIPSRFLIQKQLLPVVSSNGSIVVATADPLDVSALDDLKFLLETEIEAVVVCRSELEKLARLVYGVGAESIDQLVEEKDGVQVIEEGDEAGEGTLEMAEDQALIRFVNQILLEAVRDRASDVHIEPFENRLRIRYRIDGVLHETQLPAQTKRFQSAIISRIKIMSGLDIAEKRVPQDGRIKLHVFGRDVDVRVSVIPTLTGEDIVLRLLDQQGNAFGLNDLGMAEDTLEMFRGLIDQPNGIFLVTGPTGSGKTTSLYAALSEILTPEIKVVTLEDPVEYRLDGVNQIQVNLQTGLTFARGLRSILRHDPDVVLVGEIRDLETAEIAVQASLTGHFVFSTLHTNDAPSAIPRLVDMGVEPYLISSSLEGLMAQRLVRVVCDECREMRPISDEIRSAGGVPDEVQTEPVGSGCESCRGTGYRGRRGIYELTAVNDEVKDLVIRRAPAGEIRAVCRSHGMQTLREDGWNKVREGVTTIEEVLRVTRTDRET